MADELSENQTTSPEPVSTPTAPVEAKKTRAPRRSKAQIAADLAAKKSAQTGRQRKAVATVVTAPISAAKSVKTSRLPAATKTAPKSAAQVPAAAPVLRDDFADLLELEAENQRLRKSLAEKLRAENADLKKKLGLN